jgi:hypothetical protein
MFMFIFMFKLHVLAACSRSVHMHEYAAWKCSMYMSIDMQHGDIDMKHGLDVKHGYAVWK